MKLFPRLAAIPAWKVGLLQTAIVVAYILTGALVVTSPFTQLPEGLFEWSPAVGILTFLTTFVFSALFCSTAVLGYPALLAFEKAYRRAAQIVLWSMVWLALVLLGIGFIVVVNLVLTLR
ncbi:hypothetical protein A3A67_04850 [Candidatus Peribacteria bacterium RIFCSPLOWO2_01_FULL_51_18]|nr:MAG: hypothetical protein A3C52_02560 [Candidatus Peribacteria bacterium RIFCSPHIGHO2_02_FULL_51_15]OGJ66074.1 MAG: hypothetical protein A3A67_04850 [Candidatus Peribacteria bacterium RIFCSPLOWO2_01_FULL_51_18]OGJ69882.1 MAG: hypothetical protein A3J34_03110 [Candidatus Peribacteria bacterium RIFCSPLOWO2_02_FULL_51_10]